MKGKVEKYVHAFFSLASMEKTGCSFISESGQTVCSVEEEKGWVPEDYFALHLELVNHVLANAGALPDKVKEFLRAHQLLIAQHLLDYSSIRHQGASASLLAIAERIKYPGEYTLYPWGPSDHQVYIDIHHLKEGDLFNLTIFDLGAGRTGEPAVSRNYQPIEYKNLTQSELFTHLNRLLSMQDQEVLSKKACQEEFNRINRNKGWRSDEEYNAAFERYYNNALYYAEVAYYEEAYGPRASRSLCKDCVPEVEQNTGNCVVKNLLAAAKQDALEIYGDKEGLLIFQLFYEALLKSTLELANSNVRAGFLRTPLPDLSEVCSAIQSSQQSFLSLPCEDIITPEIQGLYSRLNDSLIIKPKQRNYADSQRLLPAPSDYKGRRLAAASWWVDEESESSLSCDYYSYR